MAPAKGAGADPYVPGHGDLSYDVEHYDLDLTYDVVKNRLSGDARIQAVANETISSCALDLHGLSVSKVTIDGAAVRYRAGHDSVGVRLGTELPAGTRFVIQLRYSGHPAPVKLRHLGTAGWEELSEGAIVAGQPHGAPSWFPCNDRPSDKATYRISVTAPSPFRVVANGRLVETRQHASTTSWVFEQDEPMATYLAAVHVGHYELFEPDGPVPTYAVLPHRLVAEYDTAFAQQPAMIEAFIRRFGPYPFGSYTVVVTDDDLEIPLEAQGMATFGANFLCSGWESERLVAHELAHQWFGNSLTIGSWRDIWLHEGFACYAEWLWSEDSGQASADEHAREHHARLEKLDQDVLLCDPGPDLMFDDRVYKRGALLLHALRLTIGEDAFAALLRDWVETRAHGTVSTRTFTGFAGRHARRDLTGLFEAWLNSRALPDLPAAR